VGERVNKREPKGEEETHTRNLHRWPSSSCFELFFWEYCVMLWSSYQVTIH